MDIESSLRLELDFTKLAKIAQVGCEVVPVVVQHARTREVLILAYVNEAALQQTIATRIATFWSTSRNALWVKGAISGDTLIVDSISVNCEQNSLLFQVLPTTPGVCHTQDASGQTRATCFYRKLNLDEGFLTFS